MLEKARRATVKGTREATVRENIWQGQRRALKFARMSYIDCVVPCENANHSLSVVVGDLGARNSSVIGCVLASSSGYSRKAAAAGEEMIST